ncbi:hypothetical protein GCM10023235_08150 [Kitasatospora terrestris]|uniref:Uncharacterized protein n=2 Tax=Kitasatospora terrestris TaxID=258051 RepID=A0ABP9D9B5_9ACTN
MKASLESCFPSPAYGGFIAVVDNLELMRTSQSVRDLLELMRDTVFSQKGIRWILCGGPGVFRTAAATPRLADHLADPIQVDPIPDELMPEVVSRRIEHYRIKNRPAPVIPVGAGGFWYLYDLVNRNLRTALSLADDFSEWLHWQFGADSSKSEDLELLEVWLAETADKCHAAAQEWIDAREWIIFDTLAVHGGICRPSSDYDDFGFHSPDAMRSSIRMLKDANLVTHEKDEMNKRRKIVAMTPSGWLVAYARTGYSLPGEYASLK